MVVLMKAAHVHEPGKVVVEEVPVPELGETDVLIKVQRTGICGTDAGVLHGYVPAKLPVTLGHEFSGTIARLGSPSVGGLKEGDGVSAAGGWGCGECEFCRKGTARFCRQRRGLGRSVDGPFAEYVKVDYRVVWKLPAGVSFDEGQNVLNAARVKPVSAILDLLPTGADLVVEATGNVMSFQNACNVIKPGGTLINIGMFSQKIKELDCSFLYSKEPMIYGSNGGEDGYQEAAQLLEDKKLLIVPMITHRFSLGETPKAFSTFEDKTANALRVVIEPWR